MKLCFNAGPEPMEDYFAFAHENGFPWMELSCNNPNNFLNTWNPGRIDTIKRLRDKYGLRYGLHSASFVNAAEIEPTVKVAARQHVPAFKRVARAELVHLSDGSVYHGLADRRVDYPDAPDPGLEILANLVKHVPLAVAR